MNRFIILATAGLAAVAISVSAQQQADPVKTAADALGATTLKTLKFTGFGANYSVGQSPSATEAWPRVAIKSYEASINYDASAMLVEMLREQGPTVGSRSDPTNQRWPDGPPPRTVPRGGGQPFTGEQRQIQAVSGNAAWNVGFGPPPPPDPNRVTAAEAFQIAGVPPPTPARGRGEGPAGGGEGGARGRGTPGGLVAQPPQPAVAAAGERAQQLWLTPHGFLKAAIANKATTRKVPRGTEVSFTVNGKFKMTGLINNRNEVERVQTWVDNPVLGDMLVETTYTNYQKFEGLTFPLRIVQTQGGHPALELWVSSVSPNEMVDTAVPEPVKTATVPPVRVDVQRIANGVYYLTGGTHHSVAIEMRDHIVMVEGPLNEERSLAVIAKVKETIPGKPIRFVINTHLHFDHAGGLRTYVSEGATVVTHQSNRAYLEKAWAAPRTINPDRLSQSKKIPVFRTFMTKDVLTDGARTIEVHRIADNPHNDGFAMVYLPAEKILIEADAYTPGAPSTPAVSPTTLNLYQNIQRLRLNVDRIAALHGPRIATMRDLEDATGRAGTN
jgi:glyoxylase-like metal-dependent hydrolase (beta-lactamase superfamily II)